MSHDTQPDSTPASSPDRGQIHAGETNQVPPESQQRNDLIPDLETSNSITGSITAGNAQENQQSEAEPDACVPGTTYGCDSVPSVSEDYVPWLGIDIYALHSPFLTRTLKSVIPQAFQVLVLLSAPFRALAVVILGIRLVITGDLPEPDPFRWTVLFLIGSILDLGLLDIFGLALAFYSNVSRLKVGLGPRKSFESLRSLIVYWSLTMLICVGILVGIYSLLVHRPTWSSVGILDTCLGHFMDAKLVWVQRNQPYLQSHYDEHGNYKPVLSTFLKFDMQAFNAIRHNKKLCNQGFIGNPDLYGLGSRLSLYLQWLTALLVNNFVPRIRNDLRKVYLAYSLGLCIATFVFTFSTACTFAVEIEILYWAYWGGHLCVFATSPSYTRLGSEIRWIGLDWTTGINYPLHILMFYHSTFFWHYGYDQVFSRLPCGTYHFFFVPLLDPSKSFWLLRDALTIIINPANIALILIIPTVTFVLIYEIKKSICDSSIYQSLGIYLSGLGRPNSEMILTVDAAQDFRGSRFRNCLRAFGSYWVALYRTLKELSDLPPHGRGGIRLITPVDIEQRRKYRLRCALLGLASYILSFTTVEITLQSNKIFGVNSIASTGQYLAFVLGVSTFIIALWQALKQETVRRRDLLRRHTLNQDTEEMELETLPHTTSGAIRYAFGQVDVAFMANGGVFETPSVTRAEDSEGVLERTSISSTDSEDRYIMSGALEGHATESGQ